MAKSFSRVRPLTSEKWDNSKYVVRFNIVESTDEEGSLFEYDEVLVPSLDRADIINALVRERYSESAELALAFGREGDAEELAAHEAYVVECKSIADEILG